MGTRAQINFKSGEAEGRFAKVTDGYPAGVAGLFTAGIRELAPEGAEAVDLRTVSFGEMLRSFASAGKLDEMEPSRIVGDASFLYVLEARGNLPILKVYNRLCVGNLGDAPVWVPLYKGDFVEFAGWARTRTAGFTESQN